MIVRELTGEDTEQYRILRLECLQLYPGHFGMSFDEYLAEPIGKTKESIEASFKSSDKFLLGAFENDSLIGIANFEGYRGKKRRHKGHVTRVYVTPQAQRKKVASRLLEELLRRAKAIPEMLLIDLGVSEDNEPAIKLYRSYGFEEYGREPKAYKFDDGSFSGGNLLMVLELDKT